MKCKSCYKNIGFLEWLENTSSIFFGKAICDYCNKNLYSQNLNKESEDEM
jgi:hypothetical protein